MRRYDSGAVFQRVDAVVERDVDTDLGVRVRGHQHPEGVGLVDGGADFGVGLVAPAHFVAHRQHAAARVDLHPVGAGTGPLAHALTAFVWAVGDGVAVRVVRRGEEVTVTGRHADLTVDDDAGSLLDALGEDTGDGKLTLVTGEVAQGGDPGTGGALRVGRDVKDPLFGGGDQRPARPVDRARSGVGAQVNVRVDEAGDDAVFTEFGRGIRRLNRHDGVTAPAQCARAERGVAVPDLDALKGARGARSVRGAHARDPVERTSDVVESMEKTFRVCLLTQCENV